jgi:DNA-directed RNA polymerase subunit RPC12/RpoP
MRADPTIVCVDCGGRAHLLTILDDEPVEPGDVIAYRCEDCGDRWDIVVPDEDDEPEGPPADVRS